MKIDYLFVFTNVFNYLMQLAAVAFLAGLFGIKQKVCDVRVRCPFFPR